MRNDFIRILVGLAAIAGGVTACYFLGLEALVLLDGPQELISTPLRFLTAPAIGLLVISFGIAVVGLSHLVGWAILGIAEQIRKGKE
jgi:hypothetical protein